MLLLKQKISPSTSRRSIHTLHSLADRFRLPSKFIAQYDPIKDPSKKVSFGFNGLGEIAYKRTYSRLLAESGKKEQWHETVERVVNGAFTML